MSKGNTQPGYPPRGRARQTLLRILAVAMLTAIASVSTTLTASATDSWSGWTSGSGHALGSGPGQILNEFYSIGANATYRQKWTGAYNPSVAVPGWGGSVVSGEVWCIEGGTDIGYTTSTYSVTTESNVGAAYALWLSERRGNSAQGDWSTPAAHAGVMHYLYRYAYPGLGQNTSGSNYSNRIWNHSDFTGEGFSNTLASLPGYTNTAATLEADKANGWTGDLDGIGVRDAWGAYISGISYSITISGPATFNSTGTATVTGTTTGSLVNNAHAWTAYDSDELHFTITYSRAAPNGVTRYSSSSYQDLIYVNYRDLQSFADPVDAELMFQPQGTSSVTSPYLEVGDTLSDTFTTSSGSTSWPDNPDVPGLNYIPATWDVSVYYAGTQPPTATSATVPGDAVFVASTQVTSTGGPGQVLNLDLGVATQRGAYVFVWSFLIASQPLEFQDWFLDDWADMYGIPAETQVVPWVGSISSLLAADTFDDDGYRLLVDEITTSGFPEDHGTFTGNSSFDGDVTSITHTVYFFAEGEEVSDANIAAADVIGTPVTTTTTNGTVTGVGAADWVVARDANWNEVPGTYVVVSTFVGDGRVGPITTSVTDVNEQSVVTRPDPGLATIAQANRTAINPGDTVEVWDTAEIAGYIPVGSRIEYNLYAFRTGGDYQCTEDNLIVTLDNDGEFLGAGTYQSETYRMIVPNVDEVGFVAVVYDADDNIVVSDECGSPNETLLTRVLGAGGGGSGQALTGASPVVDYMPWVFVAATSAGVIAMAVSGAAGVRRGGQARQGW